MPLIKGKSAKAFEHNVKAEIHAGKPKAQALAIAYATKMHHASKKAYGGMAKPKWYSHGGAIEEFEESHPQYGNDAAKHSAEHLNIPSKSLQEIQEYPVPEEQKSFENGPMKLAAPYKEKVAAMAKGGMVHPKHIALMIMKKLAKGGEVDAEGEYHGENYPEASANPAENYASFEKSHPEYESAKIPSEAQADIQKYMKLQQGPTTLYGPGYADGGEVADEMEGMEPKEKMRHKIHGIMKALHAGHKGK